MDLKDLQARLRHVSAQSTARKSRHAGYLADLQKVPASLARCTELVDGNSADDAKVERLSVQCEQAWSRVPSLLRILRSAL